MRDYYVVILVIDIFAVQDTGANYKTCVFCNKWAWVYKMWSLEFQTKTSWIHSIGYYVFYYYTTQVGLKTKMNYNRNKCVLILPR